MVKVEVIVFFALADLYLIVVKIQLCRTDELLRVFFKKMKARMIKHNFNDFIGTWNKFFAAHKNAKMTKQDFNDLKKNFFVDYKMLGTGGAKFSR